MHRIDNPTAVATMPVRKAAGPAGFFTQGNQATGALATIVEADVLNAVMMEIANVVTGAGIALSKTDDAQMLAAIRAMIEAVRLTFMPVEQGGGTGQGANKVHMGWATDGSGMKVQVDTFDLGPVAFLHQTQTWTATQNFQAVTATDLYSSGNIHGAGRMDVSGVIYGSDVGSTGNVHADNGSVSARLDVYAGRTVSAVGNVQGAYLYSSGDIDGGNITARGTVKGAYINTPGNIDASGGIAAAGPVYGGTYVSSGGAIAANNGNVTAVNGKLRASLSSGGDVNAATLLGEFPSSFAGFGYQKLPNGMIIQWGNGAGTNGTYVTFPIAFPNSLLAITISENNATAWGSGVASLHGVANQSQFGFNHYTLTWNGAGWVDSTNSYSFIAVGY